MRTQAVADVGVQVTSDEPGDVSRHGGLFHWVAQTEDGIRVTDVWESREEFERFAAETIGPITQEVGVPGPPRMTITDIHNYLTAPSDGEAVVRRFFEEFCNGRRAELADQLVTGDYVSHGPQAPPADGPEGVRERVAVYQEALDGHWELEEVFSAGDRVIARWTGTGTHRGALMGIDPTDKPISVDALSVFRIAMARSPRNGPSGMRSASFSRWGRCRRRPEPAGASRSRPAPARQPRQGRAVVALRRRITAHAA